MLSSSIMELSPYLHAIQKVAGQKPGEKYHTLNRIARNIIVQFKDSNSIEVHTSEDLPEALIPLVQLEIAEILKKPEEIVNALKSDNQLVFHRALKVRWFFDGSTPNYPNIHHFQSHILPYISLQNRTKLIKVLSFNLAAKQSAIAEEFYLNLCNMYGSEQARPLLKACCESFIWDTIVNHQIVLNIKEVRKLFLKYPNLIIKYLKLGITSDDIYARHLHEIDLYNYHEFLPMLLKKYSNVFVELINKSGRTSGVELNYRLTGRFLKHQINELLNNPKLYFPMLSLKKVTEKLSKSQFETVLRTFYALNIDDFHFQHIFKYLAYFPNDQKISIILFIFEEVYKKSFLDCPVMITSDILILLPQEERIKQARKKLESDQDSHSDDCEQSWRCYLPTEESIPALKEQISKCQDVFKRLAFIKQMIYACKINDDKNALLEVLKYVTSRHKNEQGWALREFLERLSSDIQLQYLTVEHWDVLWNFMKLLHVKNIISEQLSTALEIIASGIHFDLINDRSITEKMNLYTELNFTQWRQEWNIIQETPKYERLCLEEFNKFISVICSKLEKTEYHSFREVIYYYLQALYRFNSRNKDAKDRLENLSIKNYSWLLDGVKKIINNKSEEPNYHLSKLISIVKKNEPDLYDLWVDEKERLSALKLSAVLVMLKCNAPKFIEYLEIYYERCKDAIYDRSTQHFLKSCRWYQNIPITFVEKCVKDVTENKDSRATIMLAILLEKSEFEKFITPYAPKTFAINIEGENAENDFMLEFGIPGSINAMNPPTSPDFILKFCDGDYIHVILRCLVKVGRGTPVDKLLPFCQELMGRNVSVKKHGIRLFRAIATTQQLRTTLLNLWREEKHRSIRLLIVENILDAFKLQPSTETWEMINECIDGLTIDDRDFLEHIEKIDRVSNDYIVDYVKKLLVVFKKIGNTENSFKCQGVWYHTEKLLKNLPVHVAVLFPEEFHEEILKTYFADLSLPKIILSAAQRYLVNCYISTAREKLNARLKFFSYIFVGIIKNNVDAPREDKTAYIVNKFVYNLMRSIVFDMEYSADKTKFIKVALDSFLSVSMHQLAPEFYCYLTFAALYNDKISPKDYAAEVNKILPSLVDKFTIGFISAIANFLSVLIHSFFYNNKSDAVLDVIEFFLESDNDHGICLGANLLLSYNTNQKCDRFWKLIETLRIQNHKLVTSSVYMAINNNFDYEE